VEVLDLFETCYHRLTRVAKAAYITAINRTPKLWQGFYNFLDHHGGFVESNLAMLTLMKRELLELCETQRPDIVCCTYPVYNHLLDFLYPPGAARPFLHATVVTDSISINTLWFRCQSDFFFVPNPQTSAVLVEAGVPVDMVKDFGFPMQQVFRKEAPRPADPSTATPRVLYIINSGRLRAGKIMEGLIQIPRIRVTICAGRDVKLRRLMNARKKGKPGSERVVVMGWTNRLPDVLLRHHLVISKAGGATTQEAIAAKCPMIVNQVVPGQEEGNYELLRQSEAGVLARRPADVARWVMRAFENDAALWKTWRANMERITRPDAADKIVDFLLKEAEARPSAFPGRALRLVKKESQHRKPKPKPTQPRKKRFSVWRKRSKA
jgi:hypothetical protein